MSILSKKEKREIKELIHVIERNYTVLDTTKQLYDTLSGIPLSEKTEDAKFEVSTKTAKARHEMAKAKKRLRELGVY